jgi:hypothetical protein
MSMYTQLLEFALRERDQNDSRPASGVALADLARCRSGLLVDVVAPGDSAMSEVADQLAYDVALVRMARSLGIDWDLGRFNQPLRERHTLERALAVRGIPLRDRGERP